MYQKIWIDSICNKSQELMEIEDFRKDLFEFNRICCDICNKYMVRLLNFDKSVLY